MGTNHTTPPCHNLHVFRYCIQNSTENFLQYHTKINYIKNKFYIHCFTEINNCLLYLQWGTTKKHVTLFATHKKGILTIIRDKKAKTCEWDILEKKVDKGTQKDSFEQV